MAHPKVVEWSKTLEEADMQIAVVEKAPLDERSALVPFI
jgi:hypothetical protein